jgi:hypothetical protein
MTKLLLLLLLALVGCSPVPVTPNPDIKPDTPPMPGQVCPEKTFCWDAIVMDKITDKMLKANVASFCPKAKTLDGKKVWLNIVKAISFAESSWNPEERYTEKSMGIDPVTKKQVVSEGLLQLSYQDSNNWSSRPSCKAIDYEKKNITDPVLNLRCGLEIMDRLAERGGSRDISDSKSLGAYWSAVWKGKTRSRAKMKELMAECGL